MAASRVVEDTSIQVTATGGQHAGERNYPLAANAGGRILFDCNILMLPNAIRINLARDLVAKPLPHLGHYLLTEGVSLRDRSAPGSADMLGALGFARLRGMADLGSSQATVLGRRRLLVRHDQAGVLGAELLVGTVDRAACRNWLMNAGRPLGLRTIAPATLDVLRIEAGIPVCGRDIDEDVLPAETLQLDWAVSAAKGCYLGQEVIERMRSRGVLPGRLVGLVIQVGDCPRTPAVLLLQG